MENMEFVPYFLTFYGIRDFMVIEIFPTPSFYDIVLLEGF